MVKNEKNEELQSRREFFKRAAKGALPILAGAVLLSSPVVSEAANVMSCAGCNNLELVLSYQDKILISMFHPPFS